VEFSLQTFYKGNALRYLQFFIFGLIFGIILTKSQVISWFRVHKMFTFQEAHMYLVIGSAVITAAISIRILKTLNIKSLNGDPIDFSGKPYTKGVIIGGLLFGIGWAITGACPGPILAQIGSGAWPALLTFVGALFGAFLYGLLKPRLPH